MEILIGAIIGAAVTAIICWFCWPHEMIVVNTVNQRGCVAAGDIVGGDYVGREHGA